MDLSLLPLRKDGFGPAQARHLLSRAGFGGTREQIARLADAGLDAAVDGLLGAKPRPEAFLPPVESDVLRPQTDQERTAFRRAQSTQDLAELERFQQMRQEAQQKDRRMLRDAQDWWVDELVATPAPCHEKLVLLWHGHFATNHRAVRDTFLLTQQNLHFRRHAYHFANLVRGIVRDPAMIKFLNNDRNYRRRPNENLARELMELFTLGPGNYSENDIKEGARALTGYTVNDDDFQFNRGQHDPGSKTILGVTADFDGDRFAELLLRHPACPKLVALRLYDAFVADAGDDYYKVDGPRKRVIDELARRVKRHDYDLRPVLAELLRSRHFHDPANVGNKIKSPVEFLVGTVRTLDTPTRGSGDLRKAMQMMGQELLEPPSVDGWGGGRAWINTSTLFVRQNLAVYLMTGKHPTARFKPDAVNYDPMKLIADLPDRTPTAVVDALCDAVLGPHVGTARRAPLVEVLQHAEHGVTSQSVLGVLCLMTAMAEYQLA